MRGSRTGVGSTGSPGWRKGTGSLQLQLNLGGGICSARGMESRGSPFSSPDPAALGHSIGITRGRVGSRGEGCSPGPYSEQDQASEASGRSAGVRPGPPHGSQAEAAGRAPDRRLETTAALRDPAPPAPRHLPVPPPRSPAGGRHRPLRARRPPGRPPAPAAAAPARSGPCRDSARPRLT